MTELEKLREENRVLRGNVVAAVKRVEELERVEDYQQREVDRLAKANAELIIKLKDLESLACDMLNVIPGTLVEGFGFEDRMNELFDC